MFCFKCGKQIPDESIFCSFCGARVDVGTNGSTAPIKAEEEYTLTIDRKSQPYLINPPVKVIIDNNIRLGVDNGKVEKVSVSPGHHIIEFSMSMRHKSVEIDVTRYTTVEIGFNRLTGAITATII